MKKEYLIWLIPLMYAYFISSMLFLKPSGVIYGFEKSFFLYFILTCILMVPVIFLFRKYIVEYNKEVRTNLRITRGVVAFIVCILFLVFALTITSIYTEKLTDSLDKAGYFEGHLEKKISKNEMVDNLYDSLFIIGFVIAMLCFWVFDISQVYRVSKNVKKATKLFFSALLIHLVSVIYGIILFTIISTIYFVANFRI